MISFPKDIKFKYSWRKYQQRVLDELQEHITDGHLHIIAPPGSGKTVLGLEVAIRINQPTLILAPTIAIRNQWIQRFCELFLQINQTPDWISRDIRNPKFLTVVTYQGLHAACNNVSISEEEIDEEVDEADENQKEASTHRNLHNIVKGLKGQGIKTIVVDEAHHLKNEWWHTLSKVKKGIDPYIVGLTATPPYDVSYNEWHRYLELNGPVDTEISVPELLVEGNLCPHQDYIFFSAPTREENEKIIEFRKNIDHLFQVLSKDETILNALVGHPVWLHPHSHLDWIYSNFSCYSAILIYINANGIEIPEVHFEVIGDKKLKIPTLDYKWIEIILDFYLHSDKVNFQQFGDHRKSLENKLRRFGAMEKRQINFFYNRKVTGSLTSSMSKLNSIKEIVDFEYGQLRNNLRMVILTDFIRKEFYVNTPENHLELNRMGVVPIFEKLRRDNPLGMKIGILSGSMVVIPKSSLPIFKEKALRNGIADIDFAPVPFDNNYLLIHQTEHLKHLIVHIVTQIFQAGEIEVLVGTKSLLGEGWDAPAINALILASFVGSFVLSNQMRGRAIRTQQGNVEKTGNIWHLVCIDPSSPTGGTDFELLKRRFRNFVGVSNNEEARIENGIGRLEIPETIHVRKEEIDICNSRTLNFAGDRQALKRQWKTALKKGTCLVEEIKVPFPPNRSYKNVKKLYYNKTIRHLMGMLASGLMAFGFESLERLLRMARHIRSIQDLYLFFSVVGGIGLVLFGGLTYKTLRLYIHYRDISKDLQGIGEALLFSLIETGTIHTDKRQLKVITSVDDDGAVFCHLEGGTTFEKSTFINSLQEVIGLIDNPRYVIIRKSRFLYFIEQKDFHSVPEILGRHNKLAGVFQENWKKYVGNCDLVFTRTLDGRRRLLQYRVKSLSSQLEYDDPIEHVNKWR